jgi:hypothetical protein
VHYPAPLGSDTLCRKLVDPPAGEADASERSRALPSSPWTFQSIADLLSRGPRPLDLLSQALWPRAHLSRSPAKGSAIGGAQGVFHP